MTCTRNKLSAFVCIKCFQFKSNGIQCSRSRWWVGYLTGNSSPAPIGAGPSNIIDRDKMYIVSSPPTTSSSAVQRQYKSSGTLSTECMSRLLLFVPTDQYNVRTAYHAAGGQWLVVGGWQVTTQKAMCTWHSQHESIQCRRAVSLFFGRIKSILLSDNNYPESALKQITIRHRMFPRG